MMKSCSLRMNVLQVRNGFLQGNVAAMNGHSPPSQVNPLPNKQNEEKWAGSINCTSTSSVHGCVRYCVLREAFQAILIAIMHDASKVSVVDRIFDSVLCRLHL